MRLIRGRGLLAKRTVGVLRMLLRARLARLLLWPSLLLLPGLLLWPGLLWGPGRLSRRLLRWIRLVEPLLRPRYLLSGCLLTGYLLLGLL